MTGDEYKGCENCYFNNCDVDDYPCTHCRNNLVADDPKYESTPFLWQGTQTNSVDHPSHYNQGGIECIDAMIAAFGKEAVENFCLVNAFKYVWRNRDKNGLEDVDKAIWYLTKYKELVNND